MGIQNVLEQSKDDTSAQDEFDSVIIDKPPETILPTEPATSSQNLIVEGHGLKAHYLHRGETDILRGEVQNQILFCTGSLSAGSQVERMGSASDSAQIDQSSSTYYTDFTGKDSANEPSSDKIDMPDRSLTPVVTDNIKGDEDHVKDADNDEAQARVDSFPDYSQIEHSIHTDFREKDSATEHASVTTDQSLMPTVIDNVKDNEDHVKATEVNNFQTESAQESIVVVAEVTSAAVSDVVSPADDDVSKQDFHEDMMFDSDDLDYQDEYLERSTDSAANKLDYQVEYQENSIESGANEWDCQCTEVQYEVVDGNNSLLDLPLEDPATIILDEAATGKSASSNNDHPSEGNSELEEETEELQGELARRDDLHKLYEVSTQAMVDANTDDSIASKETRIEEIENEAAHKGPIVDDDDIEAGVILNEAATEKHSEISADKIDRASEDNRELEEEPEELQGKLAQPDDVNKMCEESTQAGVDANDPVEPKETQIEEIEREEAHKDPIVDVDSEARVILGNIDRPFEGNSELEEETEELHGELAQPDDLNKLCEGSLEAVLDANIDDPVAPEETQIEEIEREEPHKDPIVDDGSEDRVILDEATTEKHSKHHGELAQPDDLNKLCEGSAEAVVDANTDNPVAPIATHIEETEGVEAHKDPIINDDNESGVRHHGAKNYPAEGHSGPDVEVVASKSQKDSAKTQQQSVSDPVPTPPAPFASKKNLFAEEGGEANPPARPRGSKEERKSKGMSWSLFRCCKFDEDLDNE